MHSYSTGVDAMMQIGIGRQIKRHGDYIGAITSSAPAMAHKRRHDSSARRKRESDSATTTDSPLLGLSVRLRCVHSMVCLRYSKLG